MMIQDYIAMKYHITMLTETLNIYEIYLMKCEIRNFSIHCSIPKTRERKDERIILKQTIKVPEQDLEEKEHNQEYLYSTEA